MPNPIQTLTGKRVLWLGDSITQAGTYISFVEYYLDKRFPKETFDFIAVGLASETVSGLSEKEHPFPRPCVRDRLTRALDAVKPAVVVASYGMNDGIYHPQSKERMTAFQKGIQEMRFTIRKRGAAMVLLTPTPFDPLPVADKLRKANAPDFAYFAPFVDYNSVLTDYATWEQTLSAPDTKVIDLHRPLLDYLREQRRSTPSYILSPDGIHPNETGHLLMAQKILQAFGVSPGNTDQQRELQIIHQDPLWNLVNTRRQQRSAGWLSFIGYTRDQKVKTDSIDSIESAAASLQAQIDRLRRAS